MPESKVFFRADASRDIGLGHVMRSLALANMLKKQFNCSFVVRDLPPGLIALIREDGISTITIPTEISHDVEAKFVSNYLTKKDILVLDGYAFDTDYQKEIRMSGCKLVSIDDIHAFHFLADVIINHAGGIDKQVYSVEAYSELYLGPQYALIREDFVRDRNKCDKPDSVLVCMGGSDAQNYTRRVLGELQRKEVKKRLIVVVGEAYAFARELAEYVSTAFPRAEIYQGLSPTDLAKVMRLCGLCICPPSTVAYEYLLGHGELYLIQTAENQRHIYDYLVNEQLAFDFRDFQVHEDQRVENSILKQRKVFDGKSKERFLRIFEALTIETRLTIRQATEEDSILLFDWANESGVRNNSFSKEKIQWKDHKLWFQQKLSNGNSRIYIVFKSGIPIGQVRFDIIEGKAFIDYSIQEKFRGKNLGIKILKLALLEFQREFTGTKIIGEILFENVSSWKTFEHLKFLRIDERLQNDSHTVIYEL